VVREQEVALQPQELPRRRPPPLADDGGHGDAGVVVADAGGHPAEVVEPAGVPLLERLRALGREGGHEEGVRVRQGEHEQGRRHRLPGHHHLGLAEVDLCFPRRVGERHEHLLLGPPPLGHRGPHDGAAAGVPVLVPQPLVDPLGRVPLLRGGRAVGLQDLMDDGQERVELGSATRLTQAERGRLRLPQDLLKGLPVDAVLAARLAFADLAGEDAAADLGPGLHVSEHSVLRP
jgi:hypothetical protein